MGFVLQAEGLVRRYGDRQVVAGASLTVENAEAVAIVGPSGCGKTTFLQMIGLLDRPTMGRVFLEGQDAWGCSEGERAELRLNQIGFVFQQSNLLDHLMARVNMALPAWKLGGSKRQALARADELLERFGLSHRKEALCRELSVGEAQRVAISRALINRPRLVLADEPAGSLDSASAAIVMEALGTVCAEGAALVVVNHDAAFAARTHRTVTMRDGRLGL